MIAQGGGGRHLWRLLRAIEIAEPSSVPFLRRRPPIVPSGALVYLLSSLLDDEALRLALRWRGNGHRVITVDVLPAPQFARTTRYDRLAHRILMMERDDRIRALRAGGVELLRCQEDGTALPREAGLDLLSRPARGRGADSGLRAARGSAGRRFAAVPGPVRAGRHRLLLFGQRSDNGATP
jgi:uncharacterized protein (DUF58 family)